MAAEPPKDPLLIVLGATGTGKSQLAVDLAKRFDGEIINGDAMQIYDGLPVITNKITLEEQNGVPHHLLGCVSLDEAPWHAGRFKQEATKVIQEIRSRGRVPILVGGTHYYTQSLLFEDSSIQETTGQDEQHDAPTAEEIQRKFPILAGPTDVILERLKEVDPTMAERWHPNDRRKIQRSLEIFLTTGRKASDIYDEQRQKRLNKNENPDSEKENSLNDTQSILDSTLLFWVHADPGVLEARLDSRVDKMVDAGLLEEVKLLDDFLQEQTQKSITVDKTRGIWVSIGCKEFEEYIAALKTGETPQDELDSLFAVAVAQVKTATRQYARRQIRWIRLKLMSALLKEGACDNLYLVDGSDVPEWNGNVSGPAIEVAESFLAGTKRRKPIEISEVAMEILTPKPVAVSSNATKQKQECQLCNVIAVGDEQWQLHIRSRRHRGVVKWHKKHKENGRFLDGGKSPSQDEAS
ncbi:tRNA dimethylallyltransferase [Coleophoma cylindrospora]|uniref:tRNA dimethylallyltransferase n=1 Tax=Coleophoma cylindrospora TaxID=1849047 RepID=A0A3D8STG6_9HELO|nr:tRNA dimethylallyltransferase [Coleophoma cylindrospora]